MIELEKLYDCAGVHLAGETQNWVGFADNFAAIFNSEMTLFRPSYEGAKLDFLSTEEIISTTNPQLMKQYFMDKVHQLDHVFAAPANPFEPARTSDSLSDDEFRKLDVVKDFLQPNNVFYVMAIFAVLPDGSMLVLYVWRSEQQSDFSEIEKQRIAIFMRYLATLVRTTAPNLASEPSQELHNFGKKYLLTDAEVGILSSLLEGKSLRSIASETNRTYGTIRWHVQNLLEKCQVNTQKNLLTEFYSLIKS